MFSPSPRLDGKSLAFFFRQLGMLLTSGVPLVQAWKLLTADMKKNADKPCIQRPSIWSRASVHRWP